MSSFLKKRSSVLNKSGDELLVYEVNRMKKTFIDKIEVLEENVHRLEDKVDKLTEIIQELTQGKLAAGSEAKKEDL